MKGSNYRLYVLTLILTLPFTTLFAQLPPPPDGELPIDQHLHYLIIVGVAFGLYWAYKQIKSQRSRD